MCRVFLAVCVIAGSLLAGSAARADGCAGSTDSGEWRSYGADLANTRNQPLETAIAADTAFDLEVDWTFSAADAGGGAGLLGFQSTPVVADGCMYVASSGGVVFATNADTGALVWQSEALGGGIFAVSVQDGRVYVNVSAADGPTAVALDQATGEVAWSTLLDDEPTAYTNASAVAFDGMLFFGLSGGEDGPGDNGPHPGGFALLDATTGEVLKRTYTVPFADQDLGYWGASVWGTAVISNGFAYVGTGQPANKAKEHELSNAIIKIDVRRASATFGEIVDAYKGNVDSYVPGLPQNAACQDDIGGLGGGIGGTCFALDVDFGASPTLFTDARGNEIVGILQKSGTFHAVYTDQMLQAWTSILSAPFALANAATAANDGTSVYVIATPGLLYSLDVNHGRINWVTPVADVVDYHPVSVANDVVYVVSTHGLLMAFDAATGLPAGARPLALDTGDACAPLGSGASIARGKVYAACDVGVQGGGWVVAYGFDEGF